MRALRDAEAQVRRAVMGGGGGGGGSGGGGGARRGRGSRRGGGGGELLGLGLGPRNDKGELLRLKDRVVEQDALLRDWHAYTRRLMRERDGLRRRLSGVTTNGGGRGGGGGEDNSNMTGGEQGQADEYSDGERKARTRTTPNHDDMRDSDACGGGAGARRANEENNAPRLAATPATITTPTATTTTATHQQRQLAEQLRELQMLVDQLAIHGVRFHFISFHVMSCPSTLPRSFIIPGSSLALPISPHTYPSAFSKPPFPFPLSPPFSS